MNQSQVKEVYLRIIDATIEGVRAEFVEKGVDETVLGSLTALQSRWVSRLNFTHEFKDDPALIDKPSAAAAKAAKKSAKGAKGKLASPKSSAATRNGGMSVADLTNKGEGANSSGAAANLTNVPEAQIGKPEPSIARDDCAEPPKKQQRREVPNDPGDGVVEHGGEDLDSDDSDEGDCDSDEEAENMVLAQHDRVKKGPRWKVLLREGIVSIRGREYLFNKATCDLEF